MLSLSTIHHKYLTNFHSQNHYLLTVSDLTDTEQFSHRFLSDDNYFSIETCRRLFPSANKNTIARLLLTAIRIQISQGRNRFLLVFNDNDRYESMDLLNGLIYALNLTTDDEEQRAIWDSIKPYGLDWVHIFIAEESSFGNNTVH